MVTNDDGIDSIGLHKLALAMRPYGEVVVVAPDREYSGASAAFGALHLIHPELHEATVEGIDESWAVTGPPALCVMFARLGLFGPRFDLVVSGINPGANVGRSVYHSGTVGAALTARNSGISGVAISQAVEGFGVEGQGWDEMIANQKWDSAATVAAAVVGGLVADLPAEAVVVNVNVPNLAIEEMKGWRRAEVGTVPPRTMASAEREPMAGYEGRYNVKMSWGDAVDLPIDTDGGAVEAGEVAITFLGRLDGAGIDTDEPTPAERALDELLAR